MAKKKQHIEDVLWELASGGLSHLTRENLAERLGVPLGELISQFPEDVDLLLRLLYETQALVVEPTFSQQDSQHDKVFEWIMAYIDAMAPHKPAIHALWRDVWYSPRVLCALAPHHIKITEGILRSSGVDLEGWCAPLVTRAYAGLFAYILGEWIKDNTPDMAKTMASVDQGLYKIETCQTYFHL